MLADPMLVLESVLTTSVVWCFSFYQLAAQNLDSGNREAITDFPGCTILCICNGLWSSYLEQ